MFLRVCCMMYKLRLQSHQAVCTSREISKVEMKSFFIASCVSYIKSTHVLPVALSENCAPIKNMKYHTNLVMQVLFCGKYGRGVLPTLRLTAQGS